MKGMNQEELANWMKAHCVGETLRFWISNELMGLRHYEVLEDLATTGTAKLQISLIQTSHTPSLSFQRVEVAKEPDLLSSILKPRKVEVK